MKLQVNTKIGVIEGFEADGIRKFYGIPFAKPPVGELRFCESQEPEKQEGVIRADRFGAKCPQLQIPFVPDNGLPHSEDCLYMNIWAPEECEKAPVLFWTTGGAFASGEGASDVYEGTKLVRRGDVIIVTYNYRVGILGGFYTLEGDPDADVYMPNAGVGDAVRALQFVHDNIAAFGGDPDNITIAGESAGAVITAALAGTKKLQGMFSRVILESFVDMDKFSQPGRNPAAELMAAAEVEDVKALLSLSTEKLLEAQARTCGGDPSMSGCAPVRTGEFFSSPAWDRIADAMAGKTILAGTNRDEAAMFIPPELSGTSQGEAMKAGMTKTMFEEPTRKILDASVSNNRAYTYRFDFVPVALRQNGMGAFHSAEMEYVFGNLTPTVTGSEEEARCVSDQMMDAWISFMHTGDPGWNAYLPENPNTHHFDIEH